MKKLLITTNVLSLLVIAFMAFQKKHNPKADQPYKTCIDCTEDNLAGLSPNDLLESISRYGTTHASVINAQPYPKKHHIKDGRACWFPLDTLKRFICLMEKYSTNLNIPVSDLGIRFYYGVYGDSSSKVWNKAYASQHTLFLVPTYNNKSTAFDIDFDPRYCSNRKKSLHLGLKDKFEIPDITETMQSADAQKGMLMMQSTNLMSQNQGKMCPPNCPDSTTALLKKADSLHIDYTN
ncbi:hypothetical protein [Deminuibacter soli]|nr:hypothetical protein [Deminuibacter soli]